MAARSGAPALVDAATLARIEALSPLAPLHNPPAVAVLKTLATTVSRPCRTWRASTPRSTAAIRRWPIVSPSRMRCIRRASGATGSTDCPMSTSPALWQSVCPRSRSAAWWWRISVRVRRCALWPAGAAWIPRWALPHCDGLPMGTRPGSLDAGVILWLQQQKGWNVDQVERFPLRRLRPEGTVRRVERHARAAGE